MTIEHSNATKLRTDLDRIENKIDFLCRLRPSYWTKIALNFYQDEIYESKQALLSQHHRQEITTENTQLLYDRIFILFYKADRRLHPGRKVSRSQLHFNYQIVQ